MWLILPYASKLRPESDPEDRKVGKDRKARNGNELFLEVPVAIGAPAHPRTDRVFRPLFAFPFSSSRIRFSNCNQNIVTLTPADKLLILHP